MRSIGPQRTEVLVDQAGCRDQVLHQGIGTGCGGVQGGVEGLKAAAVLYRLSELSELARGRRGEEAGQRGESSATHGLSSALMALITSLVRRGKEAGPGAGKPLGGGGGSLSTPGGGVSVRVSANWWAVEGWMGGGRWW